MSPRNLVRGLLDSVGREKGGKVEERFSDTSQTQFSSLIQQLNDDSAPQTGWPCLRLCVEAVSMMRKAQRQLASAMR